jgi:hypothetical protein
MNMMMMMMMMMMMDFGYPSSRHISREQKSEDPWLFFGAKE